MGMHCSFEGKEHALRTSSTGKSQQLAHVEEESADTICFWVIGTRASKREPPWYLSETSTWSRTLNSSFFYCSRIKKSRPNLRSTCWRLESALSIHHYFYLLLHPTHSRASSAPLRPPATFSGLAWPCCSLTVNPFWPNRAWHQGGLLQAWNWWWHHRILRPVLTSTHWRLSRPAGGSHHTASIVDSLTVCRQVT
jgi:hypothetical protein